MLCGSFEIERQALRRAARFQKLLPEGIVPNGSGDDDGDAAHARQPGDLLHERAGLGLCVQDDEDWIAFKSKLGG